MDDLEIEEDDEVLLLPLCFKDDSLHSDTLNALNMMRKNRHFCDVILHVCEPDRVTIRFYKFQSIMLTSVTFQTSAPSAFSESFCE